MRTTRWRPPAGLLCAGLLCAGCLDIPERGQDAMPPAVDADTEGRPPDVRLDGPLVDAEVGTDATADVGVPLPPEGCLPPLGGGYTPDLPCLTVHPHPAPEGSIVRAAGVVAPDEGETDRVVLIGGLDVVRTPAAGMPTVRVFDAVTNEWIAGPPMPVGRWGHGATVFRDGDVVVVGGAATLGDDGAWQAAEEVPRLAPGAVEWTVQRMARPRAEGLLVRLTPLFAMYVGGRASHDGPPSSDAEVFLQQGGAIAPLEMAVPRLAPAGGVVGRGGAVVVGGINAGDVADSTAEMAGAGPDHPPVPDPSVPRAWATTAPLPDGLLFVGGRAAAGGPPLPDAWRYAERVNRFVPTGPLTVPRARPTVNPIGPPGEGWLLVVGGDVPEDAPAGVVELYDPRSGRFVAFQLPAPFDRDRVDHVALTVDGLTDGRGVDEQVLLVGGRDAHGDLYDADSHFTDALGFTLAVDHLPDDGVSTPSPCLEVTFRRRGTAPCVRVRRLGRLARPLSRAGASADDTGHVIVTGGLDPQSGTALATVQQLPLGHHHWQQGPAMLTARWGHAQLTASGPEPAVTVAGGATDYAAEGPTYNGTPRIERWLRAEAGWVEGRELETPRVEFAAVSATLGSWLVGGQSVQPGDPLASISGVTGNQGGPSDFELPEGRSRATACILGVPGEPGAEMVVFGGHDRERVFADPVTFDLLDGARDESGVGGQRRYSATCIGHPTHVDIFGGHAAFDGGATNNWQRFSRSPDPVVTQIRDMRQTRVRPTVGRIGAAEGEDAMWLIVGGEGDLEATPEVELVVSRTDADDFEHYAYRMPDGFARPRRGHSATSRRWVTAVDGDSVVYDHDVVVVGGFDGRAGAVLDEVLLFTVEPSAP